MSAIQYRMSEHTKVWNCLFLKVLPRLEKVGVSDGVVTAYLCSSIVNAGTSMNTTAKHARMAMVARKLPTEPSDGSKMPAIVGTR